MRQPFQSKRSGSLVYQAHASMGFIGHLDRSIRLSSAARGVVKGSSHPQSVRSDCSVDQSPRSIRSSFAARRWSQPPGCSVNPIGLSGQSDSSVDSIEPCCPRSCQKEVTAVSPSPPRPASCTSNVCSVVSLPATLCAVLVIGLARPVFCRWSIVGVQATLCTVPILVNADWPESCTSDRWSTVGVPATLCTVPILAYIGQCRLTYLGQNPTQAASDQKWVYQLHPVLHADTEQCHAVG